ncbi:serine threonine- kinase ATG1c-like isoform X1 [Olea europaea subsp. europaea]|uniref:Serine threonine- kinase ATG1c-like isoform X1 n=1 Tax=Olea europaea subsp. europaea TaxID=158383 RepID=A0A8S0UNU3_OLEEU|nr:serine threonine- kinase ATG1c-like isoform X1 [Olea europaea subsp. europaea]
MAQLTTGSGGGRYCTVGDYMVGKQIGAGSFSTVWHARHRVNGTEVAIKEIITSRLNYKLRESLKSEIFILKKINHPNIIRLHDMIEECGKMYIILEYCRGGDLSMYINQQHGRIPEAIAKHFMRQLAEGLKILRENNLIHRDLKPQNLLLSTNDDNSVLKIADFGFARSLQPRGLAETLCGSPLYMAPEIMQLQKYDAKADLWSVGAILFQLVTGRTPYTGNNQIQLLQNIVKSTELQFPPDVKNLNPHCIDLCRKLLRRNPVERLTFEEFFNHPYLSMRRPDKSFRNTEESSQEDCSPFHIDDSSGPDKNPSSVGSSTVRYTHGFSLDSKPDRRELSNFSNKMDLFSKYSNSPPCKPETTGTGLGILQLSEGNLKESLKTRDLGSVNYDLEVVDLMESDQDYVLVYPTMDSSSVHTSKTSCLPSKSGSTTLDFGHISTPSAPFSIVGAATSMVDYIVNLDSHISALGTSQGSINIVDTSELPSTDCMTRIKSLQSFALAIIELVTEKIEAGKHLDAFSIQLVILAIWKQALHICQTQKASAIEGSSTEETTKLRVISKLQHSPVVQESCDTTSTKGLVETFSQIKRGFLNEVGNAEELAKVVDTGDFEMPDPMELIYRSALAFGRHAAVDEYMGNTEVAITFYSKAVQLLTFLLEEAPSLILNPPFFLGSSDRHRIQNYIDVLRQRISESQRVAIFKSEDQPSPP